MQRCVLAAVPYWLRFRLPLACCHFHLSWFTAGNCGSPLEGSWYQIHLSRTVTLPIEGRVACVVSAWIIPGHSHLCPVAVRLWPTGSPTPRSLRLASSLDVSRTGRDYSRGLTDCVNDHTFHSDKWFSKRSSARPRRRWYTWGSVRSIVEWPTGRRIGDMNPQNTLLRWPYFDLRCPGFRLLRLHPGSRSFARPRGLFIKACLITALCPRLRSEKWAAV